MYFIKKLLAATVWIFQISLCSPSFNHLVNQNVEILSNKKLSSDNGTNHTCQLLHNQVCAWSLTEQVLSWALKLLKDMNCTSHIQPSVETTSHRQCHTMHRPPWSLREASEWAQLLKMSVYLLLIISHKVLESSCLYCLVFTSFKVPSSTTVPTVNNNNNNKKPSLRYKRFPAPEIMLFRKSVLNIVLLFLLEININFLNNLSLLGKQLCWENVIFGQQYIIHYLPRKNKLSHAFNIFCVSMKVSSSSNVLWF